MEPNITVLFIFLIRGIRETRLGEMSSRADACSLRQRPAFRRAEGRGEAVFVPRSEAPLTAVLIFSSHSEMEKLLNSISQTYRRLIASTANVL